MTKEQSDGDHLHGLGNGPGASGSGSSGDPAGHPDDGRLQAFLDEEVSVDDREAVERHALRCPVCRERLAALEDYGLKVAAALGHLDAPVPVDPEAALWEIRRRRAAGRTRRHRQHLAAAAVVLLFVGATAAVAFPGSPLRTWLAGEDGDVPRVELTSEELRGGAVSVALRDGEARVEATELHASVGIQVRLTDDHRLQVEAPMDAAFETSPGRVHVSGGTAAGMLRVEIPGAARLVELVVDGQVRAVVQDGHLTVDGDARSIPEGEEGWVLIPRAPGQATGGRSES